MSEDEMKQLAAYGQVALVVGMIGLLFGSIVGMNIGHHATEKVWQQLAVRHHAAHYRATPDGESKFVWTDEETPPKVQLVETPK